MKFIWIWTFLIGFGTTLYAQEEISLNSVEEAFKLARANNPDLEIFQLQVEQARIEMKAARLHRLPTISASFSGQNNRSLATTPLPGEIFGQPGEVVNAQFGQPYNYNAGITVSKSVFDVGNKVQAKMAATEHDLQIGQQSAYEQQLAYQTSFYYYALLVANRSVTLNRQDVSLTDSILTISRQRREEGLINESSYLQAQILANNTRENLSQSVALQAEYEIQLKLLLDLPQGAVLRLGEKLDVRDIHALNIELGQDRELEISKTEVELSALRVKHQKSAFLPKLSLESYFGQQQFREDFGLSVSAGDWSAYSYLGISLYVPLFTGFSNKNNLKSAQIAHQIATKRLASNELASSHQDKTLLQNFISSRDRVDYTKENLELYHKATRLSLQKYEEGLIGLDEHLSNFEDMLKAEQHYLNALTTLYNYYAIIISRQPSL